MSAVPGKRRWVEFREAKKYQGQEEREQRTIVEERGRSTEREKKKQK